MSDVSLSFTSRQRELIETAADARGLDVDEFIRKAVMRDVSYAVLETPAEATPKNTRKDRITLIRRIVERYGPLKMNELYARYEKIVEDPRTRRTLRNDLARLANSGVIELRGGKRARQYAPTSETA